ncbi:hypothetical protein [Methanimicrococcus hongohii]|uniref:hypothetical protein n=1 Tax=Methanimicrococcus hongohii TaxID=3028295 RepID=UPI00292E86FE|nr:hypothetical protein [Methanimicrococcus sp. Hf6]
MQLSFTVALPSRFTFPLASAHFIKIRSNSRTCRCYLTVSVYSRYRRARIAPF